MTSRFEPAADSCKGWCARLALLVGLIAPVCARGQAVERVQLIWDAPEECPPRAAVLTRVEALAGTAGPPGSPLRAAAKILKRSDGRFHLQLVVHDDGLVGERELEAGSCEDLASAAAVNLTLLLEDSAKATATVTASHASHARDTNTSGPTARASSDAVSESAPAANPTRAASEHGRPRAVSGVVQAPLFALAFGPMPAPSVGLSLAGGVAIESWRVTAGGTLWLPQTAASERPETGAKLARLTASVRVCRGVRVADLDLAACLSVSLEHLRARGTGPYVRTTSAATTWLAAGPGLQARFYVTAWFNLLGSADLKLQAAQPSFVIDGVGRFSALGLVAAELAFGSEWIL